MKSFIRDPHAQGFTKHAIYSQTQGVCLEDCPLSTLRKCSQPTHAWHRSMSMSQTCLSQVRSTPKQDRQRETEREPEREERERERERGERERERERGREGGRERKRDRESPQVLMESHTLTLNLEKIPPCPWALQDFLSSGTHSCWPDSQPDPICPSASCLVGSRLFQADLQKAACNPSTLD